MYTAPWMFDSAYAATSTVPSVAMANAPPSAPATAVVSATTWSMTDGRGRRHADDRPHGLTVVEALTGPAGWGVEVTGDGGRVVWAVLTW